jgi:hypothetical protein
MSPEANASGYGNYAGISQQLFARIVRINSQWIGTSQMRKNGGGAFFHFPLPLRYQQKNSRVSGEHVR